MENCIFKKVLSEENELFQVSLIISENSLDITFLRNRASWKCLANQTYLKTLSDQRKLCFKEYFEKLVDYFRNTPPNVSFNVTSDDFVLYCNLGNKIKIKYFFSKLEKVDYFICVENLLNEFHTRNLHISKKLIEAENETNELKKHKSELELKLNELTEKENNYQDELYSSFLLIWNEKKRRIQHLHELLEAFKAGRPTSNPPLEVKKRKWKKNEIKIDDASNKREFVSESESSNYSTDEETEILKTELNPEASTSACSSNKIGSFLIDDDKVISNIDNLPKRIKKSTSTIPVKKAELSQFSNTVNISEIKQDGSEKVMQDTLTQNSATVDFSTQDLLDRI